MLQNYDKILRVFFNDPASSEGFRLREISRLVGIAPTSTKNYLELMLKEKLILKKKSRANKYPIYFANRENEQFKFLKKINTIRIIKESGFTEYLRDEILPDAIVLFGSASIGEDILESDIDIFALGKEKKLDLNKYEKMLNRKINIFFSKSFEKLSDELKNNLINGIILYGYLEAF